MVLHDYIEAGAKEVGSVMQLAKQIGMIPDLLYKAKSHKRGLPSHACIALAAIVGTDPICIIAASELVTEKHQERIAMWQQFTDKEWRRGWDSNPRMPCDIA